MDLTVIGKIGKPFGVKGWMKVYSYTDPTDKIITISPWFLKQKSGWQATEIESSRWNGEQLVVKLATVDTPEQAKLFTNLLIGTTLEKLSSSSDEGYCWRDLEGLNVITTDGVQLGKIAYLMATGANDVMVIKGDAEHVLPYVPDEVVVTVDLVKKEMIVNWDPNF